MGEFTKIELSSSDSNTSSGANSSNPSNDMISPLRRNKKVSSNRRFPKKVASIAAVVLAIVVLLGLGLYFPLQKTYSSAQKTYKQAQVAWTALKQQNVELADQELKKTKVNLLETQKNLNSLAFMRFIPIASWYYNDADHLTKAGLHGLEAGSILIDSIKPYVDVLGLKGKGTFTGGSAEQRIQTAVMTMGKITPRIDDIATSLIEVRKELDKVDANHYPALFGGDKVRKRLIAVQTLADKGVVFVEEARPLIKVLPSLLGESKERKYLVLFQNDKELRPTGGFITAYAVFRIEKGVIQVERSDDIYTLDNNLSNKRPASAPILKYLPKVSTLNLRDSNLSPDFIVSMDTFKQMYGDISGVPKVDGIIALDTHVLVSIIKILDDEVSAAGMTFNTKQDSRCDCPQVIFELENNISRPVNYVRTGRKDLLGALLYSIMQKALRSSPKLYWGPLLQDMITETNQKHVLFDLYEKDAQIGIEALNAAGRIMPFDGDYLHINNTNFGGAKSNLYVKETIQQEYSVEGDGTITKTVSIQYKNPYPPSNCNLEKGDLCLNATLRDWLRIYVPKGSKLVDSKGSEVKLTSYDELDKTVFDGFLTVRPQGSATFTVTYKLPFKLASGSPLLLMIQKQPGTNDNQYTIKTKGRQVEDFPLLTDKKLNLHL